MEIIQREQWGARHADGSANRALPVSEAWLHHSVTIAPDLLPPYDDEYQAMRTLESIGQQRFGRGISYTFCVMPNGRVYEGHSVNRIGAHTGGRNTGSIGICLVGNYQANAMSDALVHSVAALLRHCAKQRWLTSPRLNGGHRDVKATGCPGDSAYRQISRINTLALQNPTLPDPPEEIMGVRRVAIEWTKTGNGYVVLLEDGGIANYGDAPNAKDVSCAGAQPYPEVKATDVSLHPNGIGLAVVWDNGNVDTRNTPHLGEPML